MFSDEFTELEVLVILDKLLELLLSELRELDDTTVFSGIGFVIACLYTTKPRTTTETTKAAPKPITRYVSLFDLGVSTETTSLISLTGSPPRVRSYLFFH